MLKGIYICFAEAQRLAPRFYKHLSEHLTQARALAEGELQERCSELPEAEAANKGFYPFGGANLMPEKEFRRRHGKWGIIKAEALREPFTEEETRLDLSGFDDGLLALTYGVAAEVVDFSMLGYGTRQVSMKLWSEAKEELDKRGLPALFCYDLLKPK
jgi:hypothetical protein